MFIPASTALKIAKNPSVHLAKKMVEKEIQLAAENGETFVSIFMYEPLEMIDEISQELVNLGYTVRCMCLDYDQHRLTIDWS